MPIEYEAIIRLLFAAALGAAIGFQREKAGKPAGLRTHSLIGLGAALFTVVSTHKFGVMFDASRVAAGVVTGIGFLGAGAIIRGDQGIVAGLTTAATIWAVAAIGLAAGTGLYILAAVTAGLVLIILCLPHIIG
jgi:putative Mg2+ transporter-C (MgtC) family protein